MLTAFYLGVKSVRRAALVVTAGTAPFGDPLPNGHRIMPARFVRELLCQRTVKGRLRATKLLVAPRFDVLAHHPYSVGAPTRRALNADDVSIPDIRKLTKILRAAERSHRALPRKRHRLWVTEVSYDSSPPDPDGVPLATHARYLEQAFYVLWRQGVDTITWFQVRDSRPQPSYAASNQSGIYFADGRAKPARTAFRFPLVAERAWRRSLRVWGRSPVTGMLRIERRAGTALEARQGRASAPPPHVPRAHRGARAHDAARPRRRPDEPVLARPLSRREPSRARRVSLARARAVCSDNSCPQPSFRSHR